LSYPLKKERAAVGAPGDVGEVAVDGAVHVALREV